MDGRALQLKLLAVQAAARTQLEVKATAKALGKALPLDKVDLEWRLSAVEVL